MKTEKQMREEYLKAQERKLKKLLEMKKEIEKEIDNTYKTMIRCPYENIG